ncbi:putative clathrin assembly protein At1g03050 [Phragmites australis]|uniref:putative clathrin assembly protein At1g03050 n=1 Tax=Phragmites australis TaxID=29695 RepID=UPI002D77F31D|nr:putative clathrin assembly protein At1g03050 [Phragmites australis]
MAPSKLRQALGAVKDQTSIGLAKIGSGSSAASELDVAILKATRHSESFPADERHIREVIALTCYSRGYVGACVSSLSRRLGRTRSWAVALKTLVIVHRLLADGEPAFEQEVFYATRRGTRMLNMSDFCDRSRADAWDFSAFVRTYAAYLDDRLEYRMQARQGCSGAARWGRPLRDELYMSPGNRFTNDDGYSGRHDDAADADANKAVALVTRDTPTSEMTLEQLLTKANQLQHLLDRFIACRPIGTAKANRVVAVSLYPLVKESVQLYCELTEVMGALIEQFPEMETADCERVHGLFCGLAKEMDELEAFYSWCKAACVCRQSDVPEVEVITQKKLELMDEFIRDRRAAESHQGLPPPSPEPEIPEAPLVEEFDMNATKALPAPEEPPAAAQEEDNAVKTVQAEPDALLIAAEPAEEETDFLNLKANAMSGEEHGQQLALALFDGNPAGSAPRGDAFDHSSADWETALVQSASALSNQRAELGGGLNMMVLDGMYSHATVANTQTFSGSASSVAMRPPGAPMLALPAPRGASNAEAGADPFAASSLVPPPTYVQMSDMQTKQQLLTKEQMVWQQYGKNGMQGQGALAMLEQRPHQQQLLLPHGHGGYNYAGYHRTS